MSLDGLLLLLQAASLYPAWCGYLLLSAATCHLKAVTRSTFYLLCKLKQSAITKYLVPPSFQSFLLLHSHSSQFTSPVWTLNNTLHPRTALRLRPATCWPGQKKKKTTKQINKTKFREQYMSWQCAVQVLIFSSSLGAPLRADCALCPISPICHCHADMSLINSWARHLH